MTGDRPFPEIAPTPRPVVPRAPRSGLGLVQVCLGVLIGGLLVFAVMYDTDGNRTESALIPAVVATSPPPAITAVTVVTTAEIYARFELPTATPTVEPTMPPVTPPPTAETWCGTPALGTTCRGKPEPTATRVPLPSCPPMPGQRCVWRSNEAFGMEVETG